MTQATRSAQTRVEAPLPPQTRGAQTDLGRSIEQAVREAVDAALQGTQRPGAASEEARQSARERIQAAMDRLRAEMQARTADNRPVIAQVPPLPPDIIPHAAVQMTYAFFITCAAIIIGLPLARAFARRMDRKNQLAVAPADLSPRLDRIEQAIEAVAIEVERVSEGQRYTTRIMSEMRALPPGNPLERWPEGAVTEPEAVRSAPDSRRA